LQYAPFPAVIQDAAAVYAHVVQKYINAGDDRSADALKYKIVLIGDSSGGNLALALARWVRDEGMSPAPAGMLLFSVSCWCWSYARSPLTPILYPPTALMRYMYVVDSHT
jgi:acetyl esterase/lipase